MKTTSKLAMLFMMVATMSFVSCNGNQPGEEEENNNNTPAETTQLTPEETKEKLMGVAQRLIGKFNTNDQKDAIELADGLYEKYENYSWSNVEDYFEGRYDAVFGLPRYAQQVVRGKRVPTAIDHSYTFSFEGESVIFEADDATRSWKNMGKASDNSIVLRFTDKNGTKCEAKTWGEGSTKTYQYSEEGRTVTAVLPRKTFFTLTQGKKEVIRIKFEQDMEKNDHATFNVEAKVTNLSWTADVNIKSTNGSAAYKFIYDKETLISVAANLPSYTLIDKRDNQSYEDWLEQYEERYDELLKKIGAADAIVDILSEVQMKVNINNFGIAYRDYVKWADNYSSYSKTGCDKFCDIINGNQTNGIYYNSDVLQAEVRAQSAIDRWDDYYPEAVLYFPQDGTTYAIEEYFNRKPFTDLQYTIEDLANAYIRLSKLLYDEVGTISLD